MSAENEGRLERPVRRRQPTLLLLRLTPSEAELLYRDFECSIGCGAEDPDYERVRDKVLAALRSHNSKPSNIS